MPFLQFSRDKRGYETTALVHEARGRQGGARQKVLYWFRTPPNVKVGRPALDQEAIRWIEEHNPDIEFDWPKILETTPPPTPPADEARGRRPRGGRSDRRERSARPERREVQRAAPAPPPAPMPAPPPREEVPEEQALEQITHPDTEETQPETRSAVESVLGREQLIRFRARYAELQARIIEHGVKGGEPSSVLELRNQAEALNPDSWVTVEEARSGLEAFEPKIRELRAALGLKRRRRSRRGGRRRRGAQTAGADSSSNSAADGVPGEPVEDAQTGDTDEGAESPESPESNDEGGNGE